MTEKLVRNAVRFPFRSEISTSRYRLVFRTNDQHGGVDLLAFDARAKPNDEPAVMLLCELPDTSFPQRDKLALEMHDARLFMARQAEVASRAIVTKGPGKNVPPDCWVTIGHDQFGIELAQLSWPKASAKVNELARWKMFELVREHLFRESGRLGRRLRQHRGKVVLVWFSASSNRLPPRAAAGTRVVEFLESVSPPSSSGIRPTYMLPGRGVMDVSLHPGAVDPRSFADMAMR